MDIKSWFILSNDVINGPYQQSEIVNELSEGKWKDARFWSKGKPHWLTPAQFKEVITIVQKKQTDLPHPQDVLWSLKDLDIQLGPWMYDDLINYLRTKKHYKNIFVSNNVNQVWEAVYQNESLMDKLGVNRRHFSRVPILGTISILDGFLKGKKGPLTTLSQGGLGAKELQGLSIGEKIKGVFSISHFQTPIHFQGEVVALHPDGGGFDLKFTNISAEGLSQIIAYVKHFVDAHPNTDFKKIA